jgi:hypothetical protein
MIEYYFNIQKNRNIRQYRSGLMPIQILALKNQAIDTKHEIMELRLKKIKYKFKNILLHLRIFCYYILTGIHPNDL